MEGLENGVVQPEAQVSDDVSTETSVVGTEADDIDLAVEEGQISEAEAKELKKKLKIVVDGKEYDEELDFNDEKKLKEYLQKAKAFDSRSREVAQMKQQMELLASMLRDNPEELLSKAGHDVSSLAERVIQREIERMQKSPEEIEREELRKQVEEYKRKEEELQKQAQDAEMEKLRNQHATQLENDIQSALEATNSILPKKNPRIYQKIAGTMILAMKQGHTNVSVQDVLPIVENEYRQELRDIVLGGSDDLLEDLLTKERLNQYRKSKVAHAKKSKPKAIVDTGRVPVEEKSKPQKKQVTMSDFLKGNWKK